MRYCKYCGKEIGESISKCPHCGKELGNSTSAAGGASASEAGASSASAAGTSSAAPSPNPAPSSSVRPGVVKPKFAVNSKVVIAIAGCAVLAGLVWAVMGGRCDEPGCNNKAAPGSNYCYSHKCVLSSCSRRKTLYSNYCYFHYDMYDDNAKQDQTSLVASQLTISNVKLSTYGNYAEASGSITNNSDYTVTFVKIKGSFESSSGQVIDTDWTYAVDSAGLAPGESCKWELSVKKDFSISNCDVSIIDFKIK